MELELFYFVWLTALCKMGSPVWDLETRRALFGACSSVAARYYAIFLLITWEYDF